MPVNNPTTLRKARTAAPSTGDSQGYDVDEYDERSYSSPTKRRASADVKTQPGRQTQAPNADIQADTIIFQDVPPRRRQSAQVGRSTTSDHRTTNNLPAKQVHRQHIGVREFAERARESWMMKVGITMLGFLLMWMLWSASNGVAHWYAGNQYASYGSTHGSMTSAYLGDGDSAAKPDQIYALLHKGQIMLVTGNDLAHMHVYPGVFLDSNGMSSKEVTLNVVVKDLNGDGHPDVQITATDWSSLDVIFRPSTLTVNFYSNGKDGFKGGQ
jgi:hypothetical protein